MEDDLKVYSSTEENFQNKIVPHLIESCDSLLTKCDNSIFTTSACESAYNMCFLAVLVQPDQNII